MMTFAVAAVAANKRFTLVIDAGHGGKDVGARGKISNEKSINLRVALAFGRYVEQNCPDVKVVYTRKSDIFLTLYRRAEIANQQKADLFVSIHTNAIPGGHIARGVQTFTLGRGRVTGNKKGIMENLDVAKRENSVILLEKDYKTTYQGFDPNSPESNIMFEFMQDQNMEQSVELAKLMLRKVCAATGRQNMGAHQDNLAVLRLTSMPGCLVELGFITTADEERFMNEAKNIDSYGRGLYQAFLEYKKKHSQGIVVPYKSEPTEPINLPQIVPAEERLRQSEEQAQASKEKQQQKANKQQPAKSDDKPTAKNDEKGERNDANLQTFGSFYGASESEKPNKSDEPKETKRNNEDNDAKQDSPTSASPTTNTTPDESSSSNDGQPVFKIQILISNRQLRPSDRQFKGLTDIDFYREGNFYKYTVGASTNYQEIYQRRKEILSKFPQAFIIAFMEGEKIDVNQAIRQYKENKKKRR